MGAITTNGGKQLRGGAELERLGHRVLRVPADMVLSELRAVLALVRGAL